MDEQGERAGAAQGQPGHRNPRLDEAPLDTADGRLVHSFAYNNLGTACQDAGRLEQALQHLSSAMALNRHCYLAIRNRANVHMHLAESLTTAEQSSLLPPQHETAGNFFAKAMEQDWHLPIVFKAGGDDGAISSQGTTP